MSLAGALQPPFPFEFSNGRVSYSWIPLFAWKRTVAQMPSPNSYPEFLPPPFPRARKIKKVAKLFNIKREAEGGGKMKTEHSSQSPMEKQHLFLEWISDWATKLTHSHTNIRGARPLALLVQKKNALE